MTVNILAVRDRLCVVSPVPLRGSRTRHERPALTWEQSFGKVGRR